MFDSVALAIQEFAKKTPDKTALIVGQEHCSYEKLAKKSRQAARFLLEKGIAAGDRIVVEADHTLDYVYLWYGIQLLGATFVPLEKNSPSARMIEIAQELDAKQIISLCERDDMPDFWALSRIMPAIDPESRINQAISPVTSVPAMTGSENRRTTDCPGFSCRIVPEPGVLENSVQYRLPAAYTAKASQIHC